MHVRSVKNTTKLNDYEPLDIIVSPENWDGSSLEAESNHIPTITYHLKNDSLVDSYFELESSKSMVNHIIYPLLPTI